MRIASLSYLSSGTLLVVISFAALLSGCTDIPSDHPTLAPADTPPELTLTSVPVDGGQDQFFPATESETPVTVEFKCKPAGCETKCKVDSGSFKACSSPFVTRVGEGTHTITVRGSRQELTQEKSVTFTRVQSLNLELKGIAEGLDPTDGYAHIIYKRNIGTFRATCSHANCQVTCSYTIDGQKTDISDCFQGQSIILPKGTREATVRAKGCITLNSTEYCEEKSYSYQLEDPKWISLSTGETATCAIMKDNTLWCWGAQTFALLANGEQSGASAKPVQVISSEGDEKWVKVKVGRSHACAITSENKLWCWGSNQNGVVGNGTSTGVSSTPVKVTIPGKPEDQWYDVAVAPSRTCAILGELAYCWGKNDPTAPLGTVDSSPLVMTPSAVKGDVKLYSIAVGEGWSAAVGPDTTNSNLLSYYAWGQNNADGRLGLGTLAATQDPPQINTKLSGMKAVHLSLSRSFGCALLTPWNQMDPIRVSCWGSANKGQVGRGNTKAMASISYLSPTNNTNNYLDVAASAEHDYACGIKPHDPSKKVGEVYCWGDNSTHFISSAADAFYTQPKKIDSLDAKLFQRISVGSDYACGILEEGDLGCWGLNKEGVVGLPPQNPPTVAPLTIISL